MEATGEILSLGFVVMPVRHQEEVFREELNKLVAVLVRRLSWNFTVEVVNLGL